MQDFKNLEVWHRSMDLVTTVYRVSRDLPTEEQFGLVSQIRRSAISIPSNIAEGCGRNSDREFGRFLRIAYASACELDTQLSIAKRLGLGDGRRTDQILTDIEEVRRMIAALIRRTHDDRLKLKADS